MNHRLSQRQSPSAFRPTPIALAIASALVFAPVWQVAHAQTATATQDAPTPAQNSTGIDKPSERLDSVYVTARKVQERAIDVPLTLTTITGQTLENTSSSNIRDVLNLSPGVTATTGGAERNVVITMRGIPDLQGGVLNPNVAIFIDGVYQQNRSAISIGLLDLLRVEVIKGPVSALYGRNAYAGVINYVTTPPQNTFEATAGATYGDYGLRGEKVSIGGPLAGDALAGRLVYAHEEFGGTYRDGVNGMRVGGYRKSDLLATVTAKPLPQLAVTGSFYYGDDYFAVTPAAYLTSNCGVKSTAAVSLGEYSQFCGQVNPRQNAVEVAPIGNSANQTGNQRRVYANSLKTSYDLNIADVSTLFGYDNVKQIGYQDFTFKRVGIPFLASNGQVYNARELFGSNDNNEDSSVELRLQTKQNQPIRGAIGYYYYNSRTAATTLIGADASTLPAGVNFTGTGALFQTTNGQFSTSNFTLTNLTDRVRSPFASGEVDILPNLTLLGEGRYTNEIEGYDIVRNAFVANTVHPYGASGNGVADFGFKNYRTSLRYKILPDFMVYTSLASGTKAGGFNQRAIFLDELSFAPESNVTYEVGTKGALLDNRVQFGASVFSVVARNLQVSGPSTHPQNTGFVTTNVGRVKSQGIDLDIAIVPIRGLTLSAGGEYVDPRFSKGVYDYSDAASCATIAFCASRIIVVPSPSGNKTVVDLAGLQAPRTSRVTAGVAVQYNGQIGDAWTYFVRADARYESKQYEQTPGAGVQYSYIGAKKLVNLNAGIGTDRYKFQAFVKNLTNDDTPEVVSGNGLINGGATPQVAYLPAKRTFGLNAQVSY